MVNNLNKFAVLDIEQVPIREGFRIRVITNTPCHLYLRLTTKKPQEHKIPRLSRGLYLFDDKYFCFVAYEDNEQSEYGDTLVHTFYKLNWAICQTKWFYFHATIDGIASPSTTAIFEKHRFLPDHWLIIDEPWTSISDPPLFSRIIFEHWPIYAPIPEYTQVINEIWSETHTFERRITADDDECRVWYDGAIWHYDFAHHETIVGYVVSTVYQGGYGMRFRNILVPIGATIDTAVIEFTANGDSINDIVKSHVSTELNADPNPFTNLADYLSRARTPSPIAWDNIGHWTDALTYPSLDISAHIQAVIDQPGWASGNALVVFWEDHNGRSTEVDYTSRMAVTHHHNPTEAALLKITYHEG